MGKAQLFDGGCEAKLFLEDYWALMLGFLLVDVALNSASYSMSRKN